jgi:hypothetical protein
MKITSIRINREKPSELNLQRICDKIQHAFKTFGFVTNVEVHTSTSIRIGLHMRSFQLDLDKHDRNLYISRAGNKLTNLPTWDQRVEFNDIVNKILNAFNVSANVKSGPYTIRQGTKSFTENEWHDQTPDWVRSNSINGWGGIVEVNEKEYLEERRLARNRAAAHKRNMCKQASNIDSTPRLALVGAR